MPGSALHAPRPPVALLWRQSGWHIPGWNGGRADNRHSRRVALLKRVLPAIGLALLLLIAAWPRLAPLWERMRFATIDLRAARELQMINPRYAGIDRSGQPFVVTAVSGRQVPERQDLMSLREPRADLKTHNGANVVITAATGIYQAQTQLLDLMGNVTLVHQNGTRFVTAAARVDAGANTAAGNAPIEGHGPSGDVTAQGFRILDKGDTILFTGRSDLLLKGAKPTVDGRPPAGLPQPVARAAAQAESEAKPALAAAARVAHRPTHPRARAARKAPVHHTAAAKTPGLLRR
jgi:lipopolysaccharide export system protein LptC